MPGDVLNLPRPVLTYRVDVPGDDTVNDVLRALPARPGVLAFEDDDGATVLLAITADLRRMARSRLVADESTDRPSRRVDYRAITRRVGACTVGSPFEADWAYLQLARQRLPASYRGMLDSWRGWFVHCDPEAPFPRWVKTSEPGRPPTGRGGVYLGPVPDKHAAQRYIDMLLGAFDLCRYHHILVQAPDASACAYKEMGKCPAPCDGSVSMEDYRQQIREGVRFGSTPIETFRAALEQSMVDAADDQAYETATRLRRQHEETRPATKAEFAHVDRLEAFRLLAFMTGERDDTARVFAIRGGWIAPLFDLSTALRTKDLSAHCDTVNAMLAAPVVVRDQPAVENIGLVCRHLFRRRRETRSGVFHRWREPMTPRDFASALRRLHRQASAPSGAASVSDTELEG